MPTHSLLAYLPQDRRLALARQIDIPDRVSGSALFVDISGFTPLTETLAQNFGPRLGGEKLTGILDAVYNALTNSIESFGGSIISFAGDAVTCWFDDNFHNWIGSDQPTNTTPAMRAVACAISLQKVISQFANIELAPNVSEPLAIKVAVASGPARRFVVGNPTIQLFDTLAGATIARMAAAEQLAKRGEIILDQTTASLLAPYFTEDIHWQTLSDTGESFAWIKNCSCEVPLTGWPTTAFLPDEQTRPWVLETVYQREQTGQSSLLTELRPVVALFLRFAGINFEDNAAEEQLNSFVCQAQTVLTDLGGQLLQINIGDKGCYFYASFGAPTAHENDARRATKSAIELQQLNKRLSFLEPLQIGISQGIMRAGAYGGASRRVYGVIGDDVNIASRLMQAAQPGEVLVSGSIWKAVNQYFSFGPHPAVQMKGKADKMPAWVANHDQSRPEVRLQEPSFALPMIGRKAELQQIENKIDLALAGKGQIISICAEAGMGKSRLVADAIRLAFQRRWVGYGGACQADGQNTSYLVWRSIWRSFFDIDPDISSEQQQRLLYAMLANLVPERLPAMPLMGPFLDLSIPENSFTSSLEPQFRKSALEALLLDCLKAAAQASAAAGGGIFIIMEDLHWIDPASMDLLDSLSRLVATLPVVLLLAYRPVTNNNGEAVSLFKNLRLENLPHFTTITLNELTPAEADLWATTKLNQLFPSDRQLGRSLPTDLLRQLLERAQGNPFYIEQIINYLHDRGLDPFDANTLRQIDLPAGLHSLILSRIDQLAASQQFALKIASIIGRVFRFDDLHGYCPELGAASTIKADLEIVSRMELTAKERPEPELTYLFKHIVTREVAYESLTFAARSTLHQQFARYLERQLGDRTENILDLLAYHYNLSEDLPKKREFLRRAGLAAAARFANAEALDYLNRAIAISPVDDLAERFTLTLARIGIYSLLGLQEAEHQDLQELLRLAQETGNPKWLAQAALRKAQYVFHLSDLPGCVQAAREAVQLCKAAQQFDLQAQAHDPLAAALFQLGDYTGVIQEAHQILVLAQQLQDRGLEAVAEHHLGAAAEEQGNYALALHHNSRALLFARQAGLLRNESEVLLGMGWISWGERNYVNAQKYFEDGLQVSHKVGDRLTEAQAFAGLGTLAWSLGDYTTAWEHYNQNLQIYLQSIYESGQCLALSAMGWIAWGQGKLEVARQYLESGLNMTRQTGRRREEGLALWRLGHVELSSGQLDRAESFYTESLIVRQELNHPAHIMESRSGLIRVALARYQAGNQIVLPAIRQSSEEILQYLSQTLPEGAEAPYWIYLTCYQALSVLQDPRRDDLLKNAYRLLMEHADQITAEAHRQMFLEKIPYHRALIDAWND